MNGVRTENVQVTLVQNNVTINVVDTPTTSFSGNSNGFNVGHGTLAGFAVEASAGGTIPDQIVNTPFNVLITAQDGFGNTVLTFSGGGNTVDIATRRRRSCLR